MQRFVVGVLVAWLVLLSGLAYPQLASHAAQHAHHNATAHATVLCSWLCIAADAVESAPVVVARVEQGDVLERDLLRTRISAPLTVQPPSRAPPYN
ncbi:MAG TPA: hypothetical protein VLE03_06640 [Nitrospiraceae bacterium]|nr:hypothetical protein [Nitrospiraceae bacterium]